MIQVFTPLTSPAGYKVCVFSIYHHLKSKKFDPDIEANVLFRER